MAEKKSQTLVRAEPDDLTRWKEAATIRGVSLNQWMIDAANGRVVQSEVVNAAIEAFTSTTNAATAPTISTASTTNADPLLAFDLALNQTPTLTGMRKWVDPQTLREEFAKLLSGDVPDGV